MLTGSFYGVGMQIQAARIGGGDACSRRGAAVGECCVCVQRRAVIEVCLTAEAELQALATLIVFFCLGHQISLKIVNTAATWYLNYWN